ncbi:MULTISPECIES: cell division protein SepF [Mammaliicoccus]|uniref:Cell division protein SepF n=1 Tax=Mammaliicoccus fleurettii TaxID=150056 RepID=A0ABS5MJB9_9STAP|nr:MULTISPECIES: cell division protein SepF [Mammaliicoccus]MBL0846486.1 cell division protein SepF [Mammaliicoccus fleurettii]MBO3062900.1 cell division protein SepF [Mammaliicoccus fleurettii]MBS3670927.1 cell division protein SepF [Mammaliicoccus fleurettii]MBS3695986.1 cell division protein SepF [Mammaliicoccus fleurettii]MBW0764459.1 cell division protein SepF [Mammaliicoccus fleurettii]
MAIKDVFKGFFVVDEEEEVYEEPQREQKQQTPQQEPSTQEKKMNQQSIKSVPTQKANTTRYQSQRSRDFKKPERKEAMTEKRTNSSQTNVVSMSGNMDFAQSSKMCLFEPRVFSDTQDIADELKNRRTTLVNLQRIDKVSAKRIIDFLSGTVYAIGGDIRRVGTDIFLCTPDNVEVAGSITEQLEQVEPYQE